jgi:hypothetical protein
MGPGILQQQWTAATAAAVDNDDCVQRWWQWMTAMWWQRQQQELSGSRQWVAVAAVDVVDAVDNGNGSCGDGSVLVDGGGIGTTLNKEDSRNGTA